MDQIPEPLTKQRELKDFEIPEPLQPNPRTEIEDDLLSEDFRLWNLETYKDRHGKHRLRQTLRFIYPPIREELGKVTQAYAEALDSRPGKGRSASSRREAEQLGPVVDEIAKSARELQGNRRRRKNFTKRKRRDNRTAGNGNLPSSQNDSQWDGMPDLPVM